MRRSLQLVTVEDETGASESPEGEVPVEVTPPVEEAKVVAEEVKSEEKEEEGRNQEEDKKEEPTDSLTDSDQKDEVPLVKADVERPGSTLTRIEEEPEIEATAAG